MSSSGVLREYYVEAGWGVITGADVPGGCWVHFSAIALPGDPRSWVGRTVSFRAEAAVDQDGYRFRAVRVWAPEDPEPAPRAGAGDPRSDAYRSHLELTFDDPGDYRAER